MGGKKRELFGVKIDDLLKKTFSEEIPSDKNSVSSDTLKLKKELEDCKKNLKNFDFIKWGDKKLFKKGLKYDEEGDYPMASFYYIMALKKNPENIKALINLAILYYEFDMEKRAIELFKKVLEMDPANKIAKENLKILEEK